MSGSGRSAQLDSRMLDEIQRGAFSFFLRETNRSNSVLAKGRAGGLVDRVPA